MKYLKDTFGESYLRAIGQNLQKDFVTFYAEEDVRVEKTYLDFARDVESVRDVIARLCPVGHAVVCIDENSYEFMVFVVATLLEARTLCPMNPMEGIDRIKTRIAALPAPTCIFIGCDHSSLQAQVSGHELTLPESPAIQVENFTPREPRAFAPAQPFIFIFTSGTTGLSKIVQQTQRGVLTNVDALIERHKMDGPKKIGTCLPLYHVNALEFSFFTTLLTGNKLILFLRFDLSQMAQSIEAGEIDILSIVPSLIYVFTKSASLLPKNLFQKLQYVVTAAAPLPKASAENFYKAFSCRIIQGYGLSEAVNFSALNPVDMSDDEYTWSLLSQSRPSIGTAIRGGEIFILNDDDQVLGEGSIGELALKGDNLMLGYVGESPSITFRGGFFRTGDLGYFLKSSKGLNFFFITGRKKEIVKRFGVTVSLSEIEDALAAFPHRNFEAIAVGFVNDLAGEEVAVVVRSEEDSVDLKKIAEFLRQKFPSYVRPRLYISTTQAVRGASGKSKRGDFAQRLEKFKSTHFSEKDVFEGDCSESR